MNREVSETVITAQSSTLNMSMIKISTTIMTVMKKMMVIMIVKDGN